MQAILAIPGRDELTSFRTNTHILSRPVAGVPLLNRVILTAVRAGVESVLILWPQDLDRSLLNSCLSSRLMKGLKLDVVESARPFHPRRGTDWSEIYDRLETEFLWLPWNFVTCKKALQDLSPEPIRPLFWDRPVLLKKSAFATDCGVRIVPAHDSQGVCIFSVRSIARAERFLVAHSGKVTDGFNSRFNRRLCRPAVTLLAHTCITPNQVTVIGLLVAAASALLFARGTYVYDVLGALLFFGSGLIDEMDGMLARLKFRESAFGTWFEGFVDNVTYLLLFAGITTGISRRHPAFASHYGAALFVGALFSIAVIAVQRKLATAPGKPHEYSATMARLLEADTAKVSSRASRHLSSLLRKGILIQYLLVFALLNGMRVFLWLATIGSHVTWIMGLYFTYRFFLRQAAQNEPQPVERAA